MKVNLSGYTGGFTSAFIAFMPDRNSRILMVWFYSNWFHLNKKCTLARKKLLLPKSDKLIMFIALFNRNYGFPKILYLVYPKFFTQKFFINLIAQLSFGLLEIYCDSMVIRENISNSFLSYPFYDGCQLCYRSYRAYHFYTQKTNITYKVSRSLHVVSKNKVCKQRLLT